MDDFTIARVLHVLAVSMWMGGVAFVTTIVMPFIRRSSPPAERLEAFHHFEGRVRSEEHTSELQSLMRISYAVFCLKKKKNIYQKHIILNKLTIHRKYKIDIKMTRYTQ